MEHGTQSLIDVLSQMKQPRILLLFDPGVFSTLADAEEYAAQQVALWPSLGCRICDHHGLGRQPIREIRAIRMERGRKRSHCAFAGGGVSSLCWPTEYRQPALMPLAGFLPPDPWLVRGSVPSRAIMAAWVTARERAQSRSLVSLSSTPFSSSICLDSSTGSVD
jgi:hypothetical protein